MILLLRVLPILLILVAAFIFWRIHFRKTAEEEDRKHLPWYKKSWIWLLVAMVVVSLFSAVLSVILDVQTHSQGKYIPSQYKDGRFTPGYYE